MTLTAFVTGATGFLGSRLVRELNDQGWQVHVLARETSSLRDIAELPLTVHRGDVTEPDEVLRCMPPGLDAVFHAAASTNIWSRRNAEQERINVDGTRNVIQAAAESGARRLIYTSSFSTWGFQDARIDESSPRTDATDWINYIRTKHRAEQMVHNAVRTGIVDGVILNPAHILGPGDRRNWSRMIALVDRGKLPGVPPGSGPFADVTEVARAHIRAWHRGRPGEKYLLGGPVASFVEVVRMTGEILGKPVPRRPTPAWLLRAAARAYSLAARFTGREPDLTPEAAAMITRNLLCDSSRAQRELDYRFTDVRSLLQQTVDWMLSVGMLESAS
jgi:nucleoside-diphosphate-sugar epimerase